MTTSSETSNTTPSEHQTTSNQHQVETPLHSAETKESFDIDPSFDALVDDAVKTKEEKKINEQVNNSPSNLTYSPEKAASMALTGLNAGLGLLSKMNGFQIELPQESQMLFAAMATPLVMKHGKTIESLLNPANVDLNSNVPEYLAVLAVGVVAVPAWMQIKEVKKLRVELEKQKKPVKQAEQVKPEQKPKSSKKVETVAQ